MVKGTDILPLALGPSKEDLEITNMFWGSGGRFIPFGLTQRTLVVKIGLQRSVYCATKMPRLEFHK